MPSLSDEPVRPRSGISVIVCLAIIVVAGLAIVLGNVWDKKLWEDEHFTVLEAIGHVPFHYDGDLEKDFDSRGIWASNRAGDVIRSVVTGDNGNMSAYILATHAAIAVFGSGQPFYLTLIPIAAYGVSIVWAYRIGRLLFSDRVGLLAAFLCAASDWMLTFAMELRSYMPGVALSLVATECFVRIVGLHHRDNDAKATASQADLRFWTGLYAATALAALLTHYLTAAILAGHVIYAVLAVRDRRAWLHLVVAGGVVTLVFVPVRHFFLSSDRYGVVDRYIAYLQPLGRFKSKPATPAGFARLILASVFVLSGFTRAPRLGPVPAEVYGTLLPLVVLGAAVACPGVRNALRRDRCPLALVAILAFAMMAIAVAALAVGHALIPNNLRYLVFSTPGFCILMAVVFDRAISRTGSRVAKAAAWAVVAAYVLLSLVQPSVLAGKALRKYIPPSGNHYLHSARAIAARDDSGALKKVIVPSVLDMQVVSYYLGPERSVAIEVEDRDRARSIASMVKAAGFDHPVALYIETRDAYAEEGLDIEHLELVSETDGVLRFRYAKLP